MKNTRPSKNSTLITFEALKYESERDSNLAYLIGNEDPPTEIVYVSLKLEEVKLYKQSKFKGLTELVTKDGDIYIIDEEWGPFDWRYKHATGQHPEETWEYQSADGLINIRTYNN